MVKKIVLLGTLYIFVAFAIVHLATFPRPVVRLESYNRSATSVRGSVEAIYNGKNIFALRTNAEKDYIVAAASSTAIRNVLGEIVEFETLQPGMEVTSIGLPKDEKHIAAQSILIMHTAE